MDPAQHSWTVLAAFIEGLAGSEWAQLLDRRIAWERQAVEVRKRSSDPAVSFCLDHLRVKSLCRFLRNFRRHKPAETFGSP